MGNTVLKTTEEKDGMVGQADNKPSKTTLFFFSEVYWKMGFPPSFLLYKKKKNVATSFVTAHA